MTAGDEPKNRLLSGSTTRNSDCKEERIFVWYAKAEPAYKHARHETPRIFTEMLVSWLPLLPHTDFAITSMQVQAAQGGIGS